MQKKQWCACATAWTLKAVGLLLEPPALSPTVHTLAVLRTIAKNSLMPLLQDQYVTPTNSKA